MITMAHVLMPGFPFVAASKFIFAIINLLSIQYLVKVTITVIQNMLDNPLKNTHHLNK
ncbi:hypothetical protein A9L44_04850 [Staphylococcus aureus]|nr:hypothetical protein AA961_06955 [Staphylococcus aureus]OHR97834.1 hypothetical protein HMPREF3247_10520 [Staphylococcus sp. HMSC36A10]ALF33105.1 hypothetical protein RT44_06950 [Staphylococcus aureus]MCU4257564.1 hypothetical protein [Staphylococcus aureus]MCU4270988.1 hypothetical protein [Staphylococcus aureus]